MTDYKTDVPWNLDMARKNATRCVDYLKRINEGNVYADDVHDLLQAAEILEGNIRESIDELGNADLDQLTTQQKPTKEAADNA